MADVDTDFGYSMAAVTLETNIVIVADDLKPYDLWRCLVDASKSRFKLIPFVNNENACESFDMDAVWVSVKKIQGDYSNMPFPPKHDALLVIQTQALEPEEIHEDVLAAFVKWAKANTKTWHTRFGDKWMQETIPEFREDEW